MDTAGSTTEAERVTELGPGTGGSVKDVPQPPESDGRAAARRAAEAPDKTEVVDGRKVAAPDITDADAEDATSWLLASFRDELPRPTHRLKLNVGSISHPRFIYWTIVALPVETIDKIREDAMPAANRAMRRGGIGAGADPKAQYRANLRLILAGTVEPDVDRATRDSGLMAKEEFLADAFRFNSGLVDQLASAILTLSGYDEDNVQDDLDAKATGN